MPKCSQGWRSAPRTDSRIYSPRPSRRPTKRNCAPWCRRGAVLSAPIERTPRIRIIRPSAISNEEGRQGDWIRFQPRDGTRFRGNARPSAGWSCRRFRGNVRLLIVEDDDIVADAITRGLTAANYSVHRVISAEAAQAALVNEEFAMAVIDVGLPGADGLSLVRRLRSAGKTLPTLILTARCTLTDKVKALDLGADDFLSKPFEDAELAARCRALMRRSNGAASGIVKLNR